MEMDLSKFFESEEKHYSFSGELNNSEIKFQDRQLEIVEPIQYTGEIFVLDDETKQIEINLEYKYEEPCNRCLKPTKVSETSKISANLIEGNENQYEESGNDELEDIIFFENDKLDISYYIKSQVYLSLPMQTLCKADCKGLCIKCGNDFNQGDCDCTQDYIDPRLAKLKDFFPKE